ncbi:MAG: hypothetical protein J7L54_04570, partial [Elusimicrobia bacterium]|nr:hypothetical protein [Elusimicrobiota bacterium]
RKGKRTPYLISPLEGGRKRGGIFSYQLINLSTYQLKEKMKNERWKMTDERLKIKDGIWILSNRSTLVTDYWFLVTDFPGK